MPNTVELQTLSGNIKLRLPKSLHGALVRQAKDEEVSLNQLCLMYLSTGISSTNLGTDEFNHRLELIALKCKRDEAKLFAEMQKLHDEVEALKPRLLQELKEAIDENKRQMKDFIEVLRYIYPIYHGDILGERLPVLKIPSIKISLRPITKQLLDYKEIESLVTPVCRDAVVAYGDFDIYIPQESRTINNESMYSIAIHICCRFEELETNVRKVKWALEESAQRDLFDIVLKPCYLQQYTSWLLAEKYGRG